MRQAHHPRVRRAWSRLADAPQQLRVGLEVLEAVVVGGRAHAPAAGGGVTMTWAPSGTASASAGSSTGPAGRSSSRPAAWMDARGISMKRMML